MKCNFNKAWLSSWLLFFGEESAYRWDFFHLLFPLLVSAIAVRVFCPPRYFVMETRTLFNQLQACCSYSLLSSFVLQQDRGFKMAAIASLIDLYWHHVCPESKSCLAVIIIWDQWTFMLLQMQQVVYLMWFDWIQTNRVRGCFWFRSDGRPTDHKAGFHFENRYSKSTGHLLHTAPVIIELII